MTLTLDVAWLPAELALEPDLAQVVVIDVVRATTSIVTALAAGADSVIPVLGPDQARSERVRSPEALLCGETGGLAPPGFDLDNSPRSFTRGRVAGRALIFSTTNGTRAMRAAIGARSLRLACFRNLGAVAASLESDLVAASDARVTVLCSGRGGRVSMDDAWCAGHLVARLRDPHPDAELTDGARLATMLAAALGMPTAAGLAETAAGRALVRLGLEDDLVACARVDDLEVVPVWRDVAFVRGGGGDDSDAG